MGLFISFQLSNRIRHGFIAPGIWQLRCGGGLLTLLFGAPFLAAGLFCIVGLFWMLIQFVMSPPSHWILVGGATLVLAGCGAMFTFAGGMCLFMREKAQIDKVASVITVSRQFLFWRKACNYQLADYPSIVTETRDRMRSGISCWIMLRGAGRQDIELHSWAMRPKQATRVERELKQFLNSQLVATQPLPQAR